MRVRVLDRVRDFIHASNAGGALHFAHVGLHAG